MSAATRPLVLAMLLVTASAPSARAVTYCSTFNDALLTTTLEGFDSCGFFSETFADAVELCGDEVFAVAAAPGTQVTCDFCFWAEFGAFENEFGIVALDEIPFAPTDPGFRLAALTAPSNQVIFAGAGPMNEEPGVSHAIVIDANRTYLFWLVQNSTRADAIANPLIQVFFSIASANTDGMVDHLKFFSSAANGGATAFAWEDLTGGGDINYADLVFTTRCAFIPNPPDSCDPLTQGFWKRQCRGLHPSGESERLGTYAPCVSQTDTFRGVADAAQVCDRLNPFPSNEKCEQAEAQFMALLLNLCSGRLDAGCCISTTLSSATTVAEAIDEIDDLLSSPTRTFDDCVAAQALADAINTGAASCDSTMLQRGSILGPERLAEGPSDPRDGWRARREVQRRR